MIEVAEAVGAIAKLTTEISVGAAFVGGVVQAFREARAKLRARRIAETAAGPSSSRQQVLDTVLSELSADDRTFVLKSLKQRSQTAARRYANDILPTNDRTQSRSAA